MNSTGCSPSRMAPKCCGLKPTPGPAGRHDAASAILKLRALNCGRDGARGGPRAPPPASGLDRGERAPALPGFPGRAGSLCPVLPGVALVVDLGGPRTGGAGTGGAIVLAGESDAVAFVGIGLRRGRSGRG